MKLNFKLVLTITAFSVIMLISTMIAGLEQNLFAITFNQSNATTQDKTWVSKNTQSSIDGNVPKEGEQAQQATTETDWIDCPPNTSQSPCYGTDSNDRIRAVGVGDFHWLFGKKGDDKIIGSSGTDGLAGQEGNDIIDGKEGNDGIYGFEGDDHLTGGSGGEQLSGGPGHDKMFGGPGRDNLWGAEGNDYMDGGDGDEYSIAGDAGADRIIGGSGNDKIYHSKRNVDNSVAVAADGSRDIINCGFGNDEVWINSGGDKDMIFNCEVIHSDQKR